MSINIINFCGNNPDANALIGEKIININMLNHLIKNPIQIIRKPRPL